MAKVKTDVTALEMTSQPFSQEKMNAIFQVSNREPDRLLSRESSWLEFKESFGAKSWEKYARTCAAFANAKGGYLVFGVGNSPRTLKGLLDSRFGDTDPKDFTVYLNSAFAPEIQWEMHLHEYQGKRFGLIYVYEAKTKPIIALKTIGEAEVKEGDIYYRYRARSERIKYAELHEILENRRRRDLDLWLRFLQKIAKVGVQNTAILDTYNGTLSGPGATLVIDEELLDRLKFIREGEFNEVAGAPTLKVVGDVSTFYSYPADQGCLSNKSNQNARHRTRIPGPRTGQRSQGVY